MILRFLSTLMGVAGMMLLAASPAWSAVVLETTIGPAFASCIEVRFGTIRIKVDESAPGVRTGLDPIFGEWYDVRWTDYLISASADIEFWNSCSEVTLGSGRFVANPAATSPFDVHRGLISEIRSFTLFFDQGQVPVGERQLLNIEFYWSDDQFVYLTDSNGDSPYTSVGPFPLDPALFDYVLSDWDNGTVTYLDVDGVTVATSGFEFWGFDVVPVPVPALQPTGLFGLASILLALGLVGIAARRRRSAAQ